MVERWSVGLDDVWSFGKLEKPESFSLKQSYPVGTFEFKALIVSVCEAVWHAHKTDFEERVLKLQRPRARSPYFSREEGDVDGPGLIAGAKLYVHTKLNAEATRKLLGDLLQAFGYKPEDFAVQMFKPDVEELNLNSSGTV
jgi:hypothetical protein